jgi:ABC-2 type transport system ATP-binding protein
MDLIEAQSFEDIVLENIYLQLSSKKTILKGINLGVKRGTSFAFIGHNGSGKSTILKLITAQIAKSTGRIWFAGEQIKSQHSKIFEKFGLCPQVMYLIPEMTVMSHLRTLFLIKGAPIKGHREFIHELLGIFEMEEDAHKEIQQLSGGNKRKLCLLSALVGLPRYFFFDEPTIGIDSHSQSIFGEFIDTLTLDFGSTAL